MCRSKGAALANQEGAAPDIDIVSRRAASLTGTSGADGAAGSSAAFPGPDIDGLEVDDNPPVTRPSVIGHGVRDVEARATIERFGEGVGPAIDLVGVSCDSAISAESSVRAAIASPSGAATLVLSGRTVTWVNHGTLRAAGIHRQGEPHKYSKLTVGLHAPDCTRVFCSPFSE
jgi:hypothetical protein